MYLLLLFFLNFLSNYDGNLAGIELKPNLGGADSCTFGLMLELVPNVFSFWQEITYPLDKEQRLLITWPKNILQK